MTGCCWSAGTAGSRAPVDACLAALSSWRIICMRILWHSDFRVGRMRLAVALAVAAAALVLDTVAQAALAPEPGLYQIGSGRFRSCCGFAGGIVQALPRQDQAYFLLEVAPDGTRATLTLLEEDQQSVFSIPAILTRPEFSFRFAGGLVSPGSIEFSSRVAPLDPGQASYGYVASYGTNTLELNGQLNLPCLGCADLPLEFTHSNVVATLVVPAPRIEATRRDDSRIRFRFFGEPGYDYFVEYTDRLPGLQWLSLTNYRAKLQPIEAAVEDSTTNAPARFYRVRKQDCHCD